MAETAIERVVRIGKAAAQYAAYFEAGRRDTNGVRINITIGGWRADVEAAYRAGAEAEAAS